MTAARHPERLGPYRLERELGRGGGGVVFAARHEVLDRPVALKVLAGVDPTRAERFRREALAMSQLRHPHIVPLHEFAQEGGVTYLTTDLIEGATLAQRLEAGGPLPFAEAARLAELLAGALAYAHSRGVLHRDVKPANVLLGPDGAPLLSDFGLAGLREQGAQSITTTGNLLGTPLYMSPEQAAGDKQRTDGRSDVYSLGATLYEMLTGAPPVMGDSLAEVLVAIAQRAPRAPGELRPGLPPALQAICLRCLEKQPERRFPDAAALADALADWRQRQSAPPARGRVSFVVAVAAGVVVGAAGGLVARPRGPAASPAATPAPSSAPAPAPSPLVEATRRSALGWAEAAEEARWEAFAAEPDGPALGDLVRAGLEGDDPLALARGWEEAARRLDPARRPAEATAALEREPVLATLEDPGAAPARRVRAALVAVHFRDERAGAALASAARGDGPALRAAALASLLAGERLADGPLPDEAPAFARWVDRALRDDALLGAGHALTLLERAACLGADDGAPLLRLVGARGVLLRAALPLAVGLAATRPGGLPDDAAADLLEALVRDQDPLVTSQARRVRGALRLLASPGGEPAPPAELLLARALAREPGAAPEIERAAERALLRAAEAGEGRACEQRAWDALASGEHDAARDLARRAAAAGRALGAAEVLAQADALEGRAPAPLPAEGDPTALARARERLELARGFGVAAVPERLGAVRLTLRFAGERAPALDRALDVQAPGGGVTPSGVESKWLRLVSRFGFSSWWAAEVVGQSADAEHVTLCLGASGDVTDYGGLALATGREARTEPRTTVGLTLDGQRLKGAPRSARLQLLRRRGRAAVAPEGAAAGWQPVPARLRAGRRFYLRQEYNQPTSVARVVLVGRWDGAPAAAGAAGAAELAAWSARLVPLDGGAPLVHQRQARADAPGTLADLRAQGSTLRAQFPWVGIHREPAAVGVARLRGDVELRARVRFEPRAGRQAGLALRCADGCGDNARLYVSAEGVSFWFQRGEAWDRAAAIGPRPRGPAVDLVLRRLGDDLHALHAPPDGEPQPLPGSPLRLPFHGHVDALLYATQYPESRAASAPEARFDEVSVRVPGAPR